MNADRIMDAMQYLDDDLLLEAEAVRGQNNRRAAALRLAKKRRRIWGTLIAAAALFVLVGVTLFQTGRANRMASSSDVAGAADSMEAAAVVAEEAQEITEMTEEAAAEESAMEESVMEESAAEESMVEEAARAEGGTDTGNAQQEESAQASAFAADEKMDTAAAESESKEASSPTEAQAERMENAVYEESSEEKSAMQMTINGTAVDVVWEDNEAVTALLEKVKEGPVLVDLSPYGGFEQVGPLGFQLPSDDMSTTTNPGDIVLYNGNQIVVFYGNNTWAYTRLGHIDGLSAAALRELLGGSGVTLEITAP